MNDQFKKKYLQPLSKEEVREAEYLSKRINEVFYEGSELISIRLSALTSLINYWALIAQVNPVHMKEFFEHATETYEKEFQKAYEHTPLNIHRV
jgi:hypothetical protein